MNLLQFRVLGFGLLQDWDVGVGVFPESEEVLVSSAGVRAGVVRGGALRELSYEGVGASQADMCQRADRLVQNGTAVVDDFLKLRDRGASIFCRQISFSPVGCWKGRRTRKRVSPG